MRVRTTVGLLTLALTFAVGACSDDTAAPDSSVDLGGSTEMGADSGQQGDGGLPDVASADGSQAPDLSPDKGVGVVPPVPTASHTGWNKKACDSCHSLPVRDHTETRNWKCAECHGGNGACKPNGSGSSKKNHQASDSCTSSCHANTGHGFTSAAACVSCHLATQGTVDCP